jgi:hypothetical protein
MKYASFLFFLCKIYGLTLKLKAVYNTNVTTNNICKGERLGEGIAMVAFGNPAVYHCLVSPNFSELRAV